MPSNSARWQVARGRREKLQRAVSAGAQRCASRAALRSASCNGPHLASLLEQGHGKHEAADTAARDADRERAGGELLPAGRRGRLLGSHRPPNV
jgi:hypothetical protein